MSRRSWLGVLLFAAFCCACRSAAALGPTSGDISTTIPFISVHGTDAVRILSGANVSYLDAYDSSSARVLAGEISHLTLHDRSSARIEGGTISYVNVLDQSTVQIDGGIISYVKPGSSGRVEIRNLSDLSWLWLSGTGQAHVYGRNLRFSSGRLFGNWANGRSFEFWAVRSETPSAPPVTGPYPQGLVLHEIPEPAAAGLAIAGICAIWGRLRPSARRRRGR